MGRVWFVGLSSVLWLACGADAGDPVADTAGEQPTADVVESGDADGTASGDAGDDGADGDELPPLDLVPAPHTWAPNPETAPVFDTQAVKTLELTFTDAERTALFDCWTKPSSDVKSGKTKCWSHCTATLDGKTSADAACRPKGDPEKWEDQNKPQLIVRFDEWNKAGRFFGLRRFNLENNPDYVAPVRDRVGMWFMHEVGLVAPRVALMRVTINGDEYGPYQVIEPIDKELLGDHYQSDAGDLYDDTLELVTNEDTSTSARLDEFLDLPDEEVVGQDHGEALAGMDALGDLGELIRHVAAEAALGTVDNFIDGAGNTYFYDVPGVGLTTIPWDLDDIFSHYTSATEALDTCVGPAKFADEPNKVCVVIHDTPETEAAFRAEVRRIRDEVFPGLIGTTEAACAQARSFVAADPYAAGDAGEFDADCAAISQRIADRAAFLATAL